MKTVAIDSARKWRIELLPVETFVLRIVAFIMALNIGLLLFRGGAIDAQAYGTLAVVAVLVATLGQYYRQSGRGEAIAAALTACALMILFSNSVIVFNYLLLPLGAGSIDPFLMKLDALVGYSWPQAVAFGGENPTFNMLARYAYMSTMPQITVLIVLLGLMGKTLWLHRFLLTIVITSVMLICFWAIFPSHGPSAFLTLSQDVVRQAQPIVGSNYGATLLAMMVDGPKVVTPSDVEGLIAFPSYHTALAFICAYCAWGIRKLFPIFLVLNAMILPGTLIHGGHHLVDLPAGFVLFVIGIWCANRVLRSHGTSSSTN